MRLLHIFIPTHCPLRRSDCFMQYFFQPADAIMAGQRLHIPQWQSGWVPGGPFLCIRATVMVHNADDKRVSRYLLELRGCRQGAGSPWGRYPRCLSGCLSTSHECCTPAPRMNTHWTVSLSRLHLHGKEGESNTEPKLNLSWVHCLSH